MYKTKKAAYWFWVGLILICVFYCLYYVLFLYRVVEMPIRGRHVVKFLYVLLVYGAGLTALRRWGMPWMIRLWHLCYLFIVGALLVLGGFEWIYGKAPAALRSLADSLLVLLISPILYVSMRIIDGLARPKDT